MTSSFELSADTSLDTKSIQSSIKRKTVSCVPCVAAKVKCDKDRPCSRCVKRGTAAQCVDPKKHVRKPKVKRACVLCRRDKFACSTERPCEKCVKLGREKFCVDVEISEPVVRVKSGSSSSSAVSSPTFASSSGRTSTFSSSVSVSSTWSSAESIVVTATAIEPSSAPISAIVLPIGDAVSDENQVPAIVLSSEPDGSESKKYVDVVRRFEAASIASKPAIIASKTASGTSFIPKEISMNAFLDGSMIITKSHPFCSTVIEELCGLSPFHVFDLLCGNLRHVFNIVLYGLSESLPCDEALELVDRLAITARKSCMSEEQFEDVQRSARSLKMLVHSCTETQTRSPIPRWVLGISDWELRKLRERVFEIESEHSILKSSGLIPAVLFIRFCSRVNASGEMENHVYAVLNKQTELLWGYSEEEMNEFIMESNMNQYKVNTEQKKVPSFILRLYSSDHWSRLYRLASSFQSAHVFAEAKIVPRRGSPVNCALRSSYFFMGDSLIFSCVVIPIAAVEYAKLKLFNGEIVPEDYFESGIEKLSKRVYI